MNSQDYIVINQNPAVIDSSATIHQNIKLQTAEEIAMELLLERIHKLEQKVFELENKF